MTPQPFDDRPPGIWIHRPEEARLPEVFSDGFTLPRWLDVACVVLALGVGFGVVALIAVGVVR